MAIITEQELKRQLASKDIANAYIIFGEDGYLKKLYSDKIANSISSPDDIFNYCKFDAECDLQSLYDFTVQLPLMADRKLAILYDYDFEGVAKSEFERLCELIKELPDTCVLLIQLENIDFDRKKSTRFKTLCSMVDKIGGVTAALDHRSIPELVKVLSDGALKRGSKLPSDAARHLVETVGDDINSLQAELNKLCAFSGENVITKEIIDKVCIKTVEASLFDLSKHILSGNSTAALTLLDELFYMRIEPMAMLSTISSCYTDMYRVYSAKQNGISSDEVVKLYGYKNKAFLVERAAKNLYKFDEKKLRLSLNEIYNADKRLKSFSQNGRVILEELVVRLIHIAVKGETVD